MADMVPLERTITNAIIGWLKRENYFVVKIHGAAYQTAGLPDIIAIDRRGRFVGLEVKRPNLGRLTQLQRRTLETINMGGGYAVVVRSLEDAVAAMRASEKGDVAFRIDPAER